MKSKQSNSKKFFVPYPQQSGPPRNWGDETDIDMAVDTPASAPVADESSPRVQTGGLNVSTPHVQTGGSNVSMPRGQGMGTSTTRPNIESTAIPYGDNQPADPNLWDDSFSSILYLGQKSLWTKTSKTWQHHYKESGLTSNNVPSNQRIQHLWTLSLSFLQFGS